MATDLLEKLLTEEEVAARLRIKTRTLQTWRLNGKAPRSTRVGTLVRYRPSDVERWLEQQADGGQS